MSDKACTASFLGIFLNKPRNTLIRADVSSSHIKTHHGYDFLLYFPYEFLMNFT